MRVVAFALVVGFGSLVVAATAAARSPNIVYIMADDK